MLAVSNRHGDIVEYLHQAGADVNIKDSDGNTPLMVAARQGCGDEVKYLHEAGADINIRNIYGNTAVMYAAQYRHGDIVRYLHQAGADINIGNKWSEDTPFSDGGTYLRHVAIVQYLRPSHQGQ